MVHGTVEMHVDVDGNGQFDDDADYAYVLQDQGMGQNLNTSNMDLWTYPEFRFYIKEEHQGKKARIFVEDTLTSGLRLMCVDDFYVWNGSEAVLPFPNSDFEQGSMENWTRDGRRRLAILAVGLAELFLRTRLRGRTPRHE